MHDRMDHNNGRQLAFLRQTNEVENTIILFLSDNGGSAEVGYWSKTGVPTGYPDSFDAYEHSWVSVSSTPCQWFKQYT